MSGVGGPVSENPNHKLSWHNPISTSHDSPRICLDLINSPQMTFMGSPSTSPSRGRAFTTNSTAQSQAPRPRLSSVTLPSREPSQDEYKLHPHCEHPGVRRSQRSIIEPRYVEYYFEAAYSRNNSDPQRETTSTPTSEAQQLTPLSSDFSRTSEDGEFKKLSVPNSPSIGGRSEPKEHSSEPLEASDLMLEIDSDSKISLQQLSLDEDDEDDGDMDDEEWQSEIEDDLFEQRWVRTINDFETKVLRATVNNFHLAAQLIPQLYEISQQEESHAVGILEGYRERAGNDYDQNSGRQGQKGESLRKNTGHNAHNRKKQRGYNEGNEEGSNNSQDGDRDGDGGNSNEIALGNSQPLLLACPFYKKDPLHYSGTYRSSNGKSVYKSCGNGFVDYQRFREHLQRTHRWVQCEKCSFLFTVPQQGRELEYQTHISTPCSNYPPNINEGITELQWARINSLQMRSQHAAKSSSLHLNVVKWKNVWEILFPGEDPPHPWYAPNIDQQPSLDEEIEEFKSWYTNESQEHLSPMENAVVAFRTWFLRFMQRQVERQDLQETRPQILQRTIEEHTRPQDVHSPLEEGPREPPITFQGRAEISRVLSHQHPLQQYSNGQESLSVPPTFRRNAPEPSHGFQTPRLLPPTSPPVVAYGGLTLIDPQDQQSIYQSEDIDSAMYDEGSEQPFIASSASPLGYPNPTAMEFGTLGNSNLHPSDLGQYNNNSAIGVTNDFTDLPEHHSYNANQSQADDIRQTQRYVSALITRRNQASAQQQMQAQQTPLNYPNPHSQRSFQPNTSGYFDQNARYDTHNCRLN